MDSNEELKKYYDTRKMLSSTKSLGPHRSLELFSLSKPSN